MSAVQRWTGRETRLLRHALRLTVRDFAEDLGVAPRTITKWESGGGGHQPRPELQRALDTMHARAPDADRERFAEARRSARDLPAELAEGRRALRLGQPPEPSGEEDGVLRRDFIGTTMAAIAVVHHGIGSGSLGFPGAPRVGGRAVGRGDVAAVREMTRGFSTVDQRYGGGHARTALVQYLTSDVATYLQGRFESDRTRAEMFSAAAEVSYLIGWMAFDGGQHDTAREFFSLALTVAAEGGDPALSGHVLRAMAHQAVDRGRPTEALEFAEGAIAAGRYQAAGRRERSLLGVIHARALGATGQRAAAVSALLRAEDDLASARPGDDQPGRVFFFGEASLAHQTACTLRDLGDSAGAIEQYQRSAQKRQTSKFARTHVITLGDLGQAQAQEEDFDGALQAWSASLDHADGVKSGRVRDVVVGIRAELPRLRRRGVAGLAELDHRTKSYLEGV
jgi:transcriptional regulator with XRE-family HTH domain